MRALLGAQAFQFECTRVSSSPTSFDIKEGWDFFDAGDRAAFWNCLRSQQPDLVTMSPECKPFSVLMHSNWNRMDPGEARRLKVEGMAMFQFCVQVAEFQISQGRYFWIEQPASASSWATHAIAWLLRQPGVAWSSSTNVLLASQWFPASSLGRPLLHHQPHRHHP